MRQPIIGVMGPGDRASSRDRDTAYALGGQIAQRGWILLTGGRDRGVMAAASQGAKAAGGLTIGILPGSDLAAVSDAVDIPILTGLGNGRNIINVLSSQVVVACGMGAGTASEIALALKTQKPVVLLNGTDASDRFFTSLNPNLTQIATSVESTVQRIQMLLQKTNPSRICNE